MPVRSFEEIDKVDAERLVCLTHLPVLGAPASHTKFLTGRAAAPRQDRRTAGQTCEVLLAPAGGESPDAAAVRVDAPADLGAARADRLTGGGCHRVRLGEERTQGGRGVREMSSGTRLRTDSGPPKGRHHGGDHGDRECRPERRLVRVSCGGPMMVKSEMSD